MGKSAPASASSQTVFLTAPEAENENPTGLGQERQSQRQAMRPFGKTARRQTTLRPPHVESFGQTRVGRKKRREVPIGSHAEHDHVKRRGKLIQSRLDHVDSFGRRRRIGDKAK